MAVDNHHQQPHSTSTSVTEYFCRITISGVVSDVEQSLYSSFRRWERIIHRSVAFREDQKLEEALVFDNVSITDKFRTVLRSNDLLFRCAKVGNALAQHLLSKRVLVMSFSLLYKREGFQLHKIRCSPDPTTAENYDEYYDAFSAAGIVKRIIKGKEAGLHDAEIVQSFLRRCTASEMAKLGEHLINYVCYFSLGGTSHHERFSHRVKAMIMFGKDIDAGAEVNLLEISKMIYAKQRALSEQWYSRKKTRGVLYSYSVSEELRKEMYLLHTKMVGMYELGLVCPDDGCYEKDPSIYFERCHLDALEDFAMFFIELE